MQIGSRWKSVFVVAGAKRSTMFVATLLLVASVFAASAHAHSRAADKNAANIKTVVGAMHAKRMSRLSSYIARNFKVSQGNAANIVAAAQRYAEKFDLHPELILAVIAVESTFRPRAVSSGGARGLMQIMPNAHPRKVRSIGGAHALFDPNKNIHTGSTILTEYLKLSDGDLNNALQRYNGSLGDPKARYAAKVLRHYSKMRQVTSNDVATLN